MAIELGPLPYETFKVQLGAKMAEYGSTVSPLSADLSFELRTSFRNLVSWKRHIKSKYNEVTREYEPLPTSQIYWRRENTYMLYFTASEIFTHGDNIKGIVDKLRRAIEQQSSTASGKVKSGRLMIMVDGWQSMRGRKIDDRRKHERMFVRLQMERCSIVHVEGHEDAVTWLYNLTADLGMKPHKYADNICFE